jgi:hypothetical protein
MIEILKAKAVIRAVAEGIQSLAETNPEHPMSGADATRKKACKGDDNNGTSRAESFCILVHNLNVIPIL